MSLSFREQAAIAFATVRDSGVDPGCGRGSIMGDWPCSDVNAATMAHDLAVACCAKWGHDERAYAWRSTLATRECARCGYVGLPRDERHP